LLDFQEDSNDEDERQDKQGRDQVIDQQCGLSYSCHFSSPLNNAKGEDKSIN